MTPKPLHILFAGTSDFALPSLSLLAEDPAFRVDAVLTQEDKPVGRKQDLTPPPVKREALRLGLPVFQPRDIRREFFTLELEKPDVLVAVSYGQILSQEILDFPRIAAVNVHASLLPRFRGASPIQHAILEGDRETGVTIQKMVYELDAGPVYAQETTMIDPRETTVTLHDRLKVMGANLLMKTLKNLPDPVPQKGTVTLCHKLTRQDGLVDSAAMTAEEIDRKARALNPWPGVTLDSEGTTLKILETSLTPESDSFPLPCKGNTTLYLVRMQPAGKNPMSGGAWARGIRK
jgi:methionyl-tRNA formyltransferase